ncbi:MAG: DUF4330 domain-containing protein [Synechococcales bacterium]|nr:DUF4330 domain-containing protein [Synechococcales bacterium]
MAILDSRGRLFGKISILDVGAALMVLLVILGIFLVPGNSGSVAQIGATTKPVEVDLIVRGLTVADPQGLIQSIRDEGKTNIIIRNQPFGQVGVKSVTELPRTVATPQPDGTLKPLPDPRPELNFTLDMLITLADEAQITDDSAVFGNNKVKIGSPIELEGLTYRFNTSVVGVRILE